MTRRYQILILAIAALIGLAALIANGGSPAPSNVILSITMASGAFLAGRFWPQSPRTTTAQEVMPAISSNLLDTVPAIILILDAQGKIVYFNKYFADLSGRQLADVVGKDWFTTFLPDRDRTTVEQLFRKSTRGQNVRGNRNSIVTSRGNERLIEWSDQLIHGETSDELRLVCIGVDVTQQQQNEDLLRASEARYRSLIEEASEMIFRMTVPEGRYEYVSPAAEKVIGYTAADLLREPMIIRRAMHPDFLDFFENTWAKMIQGQVDPSFEYLIVDPKGNEIWISQSTVGIYDDDGKIIAIEGICRNDSERRRILLEARMREEEARFATARYRLLFEQLPDAIMVIDPETLRAVEFNELAPKLLGYSPEEFRMLRLPDFEAQESPEEVAAHVSALLTKGGDTFATRMRRKDGTILQILVNVCVIVIDGSKFCHTIFRDITREKAFEEALKIKDKAIESALAGIALIDGTGMITYANRSILRMWGMDHPDEALGQLATRFWECPAEAEAANQELYETDQCFGEMTGKRTDGSQFDALVAASLVRDDRGVPTHMMTSVLDITEQKLADRSLRESEERLQQIMHNMPVLLEALDENYHVVVWNKECERVTGYTAGEMVGNPAMLEALYPDPDYRDYIIREWLARENDFSGWEVQLTCKDGTKKWIAWSSIAKETPIPGWSTWAVGVDVTQRLEAKAALHASEERLRVCIQHTPAGVAMLDRELRYIAHSERFPLDFKLGPQNLIGRCHYDVFPDVPERWKQIHQRCLQGYADHHAADCFERADGSQDFIRWEIQPWRDASGQVGGIVMFTEVITDQVKAQQALRQSQERLAEAQRIAKIGSWELDHQRNVLVWSDETYRIFEMEKEDFGASYAAFLETVHPDDRALVDRTYQRSVLTREPYRVTHRIQTKSGSLKYVEEQGETFFDVDGRPLRSLGTVQDITRLKLAEAEILHMNVTLEQRVLERTSELQAAKQSAEEANRAKSEFLSRMSHELRTPLNSILGYAQLLEIRDSLAADAREMIGSIVSNGWHLLDLINDLLDFAKIEQGQLSVTLEEVDLAHLVEECVTACRPQGTQRNITIHSMRADSPPAAVYADRVRLRQVLINLLSNSIKYNRPGGTVTIDWELTHHGRLRLDIADTGVGIASEDLQLLFQPFSRLYLSQSSVEGSGIGLALSKQLVELMHGKIAVRSTIGVGSTFSVELPCARHCLECNQLLDCSERLAENASPRLSSILFIRNSSERTACIRAELEERYQTRVWEAHSGAEGLRLATQQRPDLIVTDLNLPDMTATQFLRQWRSAHPGNGTPVIAVCDGISPFEMNRSGNEGFYAFLPSPLEITSIAHLLPEARL